MPAKSSPKSARASRRWRSGAMRKSAADAHADALSMPHSVRRSPAVRQPVFSMLTTAACLSRLCRCAYGSSRAAPARLTIASTEPVESWAPNSSRRSSVVSRREGAVPDCKRDDGRLKASAEGSPRHVGGKLGPRLGGTGGAAQAVQAVLAHPHGDRRQLGDLVALGRGGVDALVLAEETRARVAALGPVIDDLVHSFERKQRAVPARVAALSAGPPARSWWARPRRRRGRTGRGRKRGVARASLEALLEIGDAALKPPVRLDQLVGPHEQGDRRRPVAVENRLRLGAFHGVRVRRAAQGPSLPTGHGGPERLLSPNPPITPSKPT